mgnify:CR=1 FL=1
MRVMLPDGSVKEVAQGVTGAEVAMGIGAGLAKASVAIKVNGVQRDLTDSITEDANVALLTLNDEEGLDVMRHTVAAQVLARAVKNLYPEAKLAIGPTIKDGFYYDVAFTTPISTTDLEGIEAEMTRIVKTGNPIIKEIHSRDEAIAMFKERGEDYKVSIIEDSDEGDEFQIYKQADTGFIDLCRGPHLPSLANVGAFKLLKVAGAYWRGDSDNEMLTRIYGTAWGDKKQLKAYLHRLEEAEKRDHRKLARRLDLFHMQEEAPGMVFWHPKGWQIWQIWQIQQIRQIRQTRQHRRRTTAMRRRPTKMP